MNPNKRQFLSGVIAWAIAAPLAFLASRASAQSQSQSPLGQGPRTPGQIAPAPHPPIIPDYLPPVDRAKSLKANQQQIHEDVEKVYALAGELKAQVESTDSSKVLSLALVDHAKQIEKLAKDIKNLATG